MKLSTYANYECFLIRYVINTIHILLCQKNEDELVDLSKILKPEQGFNLLLIIISELADNSIRKAWATSVSWYSTTFHNGCLRCSHNWWWNWPSSTASEWKGDGWGLRFPPASSCAQPHYPWTGSHWFERGYVPALLRLFAEPLFTLPECLLSNWKNLPFSLTRRWYRNGAPFPTWGPGKDCNLNH